MTIVSASRHNDLVQRITKVLGNGEGTFGYGQGSGYGSSPSSFEVSSNPNSNTNIVTADAMNEIYSDMVRARVHQIGTEPDEIAEIIANANIIAESESFIVDDRGISLIDENGNKKGFIDFESLMQSIENDRFLMSPNQASLEPGVSSTRTAAWNETLVHEFEVEFENENHRRHFFNSGGEIRISASLSNFNSDKSLSWNNFFNSFGIILFNHERTVSNTTGSGTNRGNYQLINSYRTIFTATGTGFTNSVYNGNTYTVEARAPEYVDSDNPGTKIRFRITLNDLAQDGSIDNFVDGTTVSRAETYRADSMSVRVNSPLITNLTNLG